MKRLVLALTVLAVSITTTTSAFAEQTELDHGVVFRPLSTLIGFAVGVANVNLEYQVAFSDSVGMSFSPSVAYYSFGGITVTGGGLELGPRFLLSDANLSRWYLYPFAGIVYASGSDDETDAAASGGAFELGAEMGFAWNFKSGFMINLGAGLAYRSFLGDLADVDTPLPIAPRLNFSLGYGWN